MFASAKNKGICLLCLELSEYVLREINFVENGWNAIQVSLNMHAGYQKVPEFNHKVFPTRVQNTEESFIEK